MDETPPTVPPMVRTVTYAVGLFSTAISAAITTEAPFAARILAAVGTASLALALGYRPTR